MGGRYIVGITGASGSLYAEAVIRRLLKAGCEVHLCLTRAGQIVVREELREYADLLTDEGEQAP